MEISVVLKKLEEKDCLEFSLPNNKQTIINLNSDDQTKLKELFYSLIQILQKDDVILVLTEQEGYDTKVFQEIAKEYIEALNAEIKTIKQNSPKE